MSYELHRKATAIPATGFSVSFSWISHRVSLSARGSERIPKRQERLQPRPKLHIDWISLSDQQLYHGYVKQSSRKMGARLPHSRGICRSVATSWPSRLRLCLIV
jgi:hypothetical protein